MIVATGTWGTGKTTVLDKLNLPVVAEPGRALVAANEALQRDGTAFARAFLDQADLDYRNAPDGSIFDRGVVDALAYARWFDVDARDFEDSASDHRYSGVLWFPFWEEIYVNDDLRQASRGLASQFADVLAGTYEDCGYTLTEVPKLPMEERVSWVTSRLRD